MSNTTPQTLILLREVFPNARVRWSMVALLWLTIGTVSAVHWWYLYFGQQPYTWWVLFRAKIIVWSMWGLIAPFILWLGARYRIEKPHLVKHLVVLALFSGLVSVAYIGLYASAVWWNFPPDFAAASGGFWKLVHWIYWNHFAYFYLGYWVVVAVEQMLGFAKRSYEREAATLELKRQLTEARLAQLKAQVHPHFLFNTLNAISSLIAESERDRAYDVVTRLSHLLRLGLEHGEREEVSLSEEFSLIEQYLELMAVRFPDRLTYFLSMGEQTGHALVPSLILQPLVENAVKFGTGLERSTTTINIRSSILDGQLVMTIENSSADTVAGAGSQLTRTVDGMGMGLKNTKGRLDHLFGSAYTLVRNSIGESTTTVTLTIPLKHKV